MQMYVYMNIYEIEVITKQTSSCKVNEEKVCKSSGEQSVQGDPSKTANSN